MVSDNPGKSNSSVDYLLLTQMADDFATRYRRGERPSLQEYIDRNPDLADEILELFPAMAELEQARESHHGTFDRAVTSFASSPRQLGDFRILREVGKGGMGIVYEAEQVSLGRHVALKVLPSCLLADAKAKRRFEREAKSAAKLHHTNIVPVFGVGEHDGMPYYVMQFIQGLGLDDVLRELRKLRLAGVGAGVFMGSDPGGSLVHDQITNLTEGRRSQQTTLGDDVSVQDVVQSLLSCEFQAPRAVTESGGAITLACNENFRVQDSGSSEPLSTSRPDTFSRSSSSLVLPGQGNDGSKARCKKRSYWTSVALIGVQVADAIDYAHKQGIHHRDIKPSNLLLDSQGMVWVTDFGLAKVDDQQNLTHTGDVLGTLRYLPPEALDGKTDARSDVYSLGLTLYEMLAFRPAFDEKDRNRLARQVTDTVPIRLGKLNRQVPRDLETIVHKAIEKDAALRYSSAGSLAADLRRFVDDEPIHARRATITEQAVRWCRRSPAVAGLIATVLMVTSIGAIVASRLAVQAQNLAFQAKMSEVLASMKAKDADRARLEAQKLAEEMRRQLVRQRLATATRLLDSDNMAGSLLWHAKAWVEDTVGTEDEESHRLRLGLSIDTQIPLRRLLIAEGPLAGAQPAAENGIVARTMNGAVLYWDAEDKRTDLYHPARVEAMAVSPDGTRLITACDDGNARVWDLATRTVVRVLPHGERVSWVAIRPDGSMVATAGGSTGARLWDMATGASVQSRLSAPHSYFAAFSPDGRKLVTADTQNFARVWDLASGDPVTQPLPHSARAADEKYWGFRPGPVFSPDSEHLLTTVGQQLTSWRLDKPGKMWGPLSVVAHQSLFNPAGSRVLTVAADCKLIDAQTGVVLASMPNPRDCQQAAFIDKDIVAMSSTSGLLSRWQVNGPQPSRIIGTANLVDTIRSLVPLRDGHSVLAASWDGTARVYEVSPPPRSPYAYDDAEANGALFRILPDGARSYYSPNGMIFCAYGPGKGSVQIGSARSGSQSIVLKTDRPVRLHAFSGDSTRIALADSDGIQVFSTKDGAPMGPKIKQPRPPWRIQLDNSGSRMLTLALPPKTAAVYEVESGKALLERVFDSKEIEVLNVGRPRGVLAPDGKRVAWTSSFYAGPLEVWDVDGRTMLSRFSPHRGWYWGTGFAFSNDGSKLLVWSSDTTMRLWDAATGKALGPPLAHHNGALNGSLSTDCRFAVGSSHGLFYLWNVTSGQLYARWKFEPPPGGVPSGVEPYAWLDLERDRIITTYGQEARIQPIREYRGSQENVEPLLDLLTGQRIDAQSDGIVLLPSDTILRDPERYRATLRSWIASCQIPPTHSTERTDSTNPTRLARLGETPWPSRNR